MQRVEDDTISDDAASRGFSISMVVSGVRCLLTYLILPFLTPLLGLASGVGPVLGLVFGTVAIVANVLSIRRFQRSRHRWRRPMTVIHIVVITLLAFLIGFDLAELLG